MKIFFVGDSHGDTEFLVDYIIPEAVQRKADVIVGLGDFGFWEHEREGIEFLNEVSEAAVRAGKNFYTIRGNHDNIAAVLAYYTNFTDEGFLKVRPNLFYIPDGTTWGWSGRSFRAFGGAYSVDKASRLAWEKKRARTAQTEELARRAAGRPAKPMPDFAGTLWFPDEEMTDEDLNFYLDQYNEPVDVIISHDKPRSSNPGIELLNIPECNPNQMRLQQVLRVHQPKLWLHGHLHHYYIDQVRCGDDDRSTTVCGLDCNPPSKAEFKKYVNYRPEHSWGILDLHEERPMAWLPGALAAWDRGKKV